MVAILVLGALLFLLLWWRNQQVTGVTNINPTAAGTIVYTPKAPPVAESIIINSIPIVGPVANYTVDKVGNAIIQNKTLENNSQVGPNQGQTEASAGILGFTVSKKGITWSQVGGAISTAAKKTGSAIETAVEPWKW